jgi:prepilin-type N-terminal cleavage/methylation domain-containing protein
MRAHRPTSRLCGFSLIEMTLVIATIAILSLIAIPRYAQAMNRYKVDLAAKRVVADFALARSAARACGTGQVIDFTTPANGYTLTGLSAPDGRSGDYVVKLSDEPFKVSIGSASFGSPASASVKFTRFGTPETGGGSVVVSCGGYQKTIALDPVTGRAEVQ